MRSALLLAALSLVACSNDMSPEHGNECGPNGTCPAGFTCVAASNTCVAESGRPDGATALDARAGEPDARVPDSGVPAPPDAALSSPDARISSPDAPTSAPDARISAPDARISSPDARISAPDARIAAPDAPTSAPDAAPPPPPPTVTLRGPDEGSTTGKLVTFTFTASDPDALVSCALDSTVLSPCPTGAQNESLSSGSHTFRVQAELPAGNPGPLVARTWTVDATPPTVTIAPFAMDQSNASGTVAYGASETATFACKLDGGGFAACPTSGFAFSGLSAGAHTLSVHATDVYVNTGDDATYTWTVVVPVTITLDDASGQNSGVFVNYADAAGQSLGRVRTDAEGNASMVIPPGGQLFAAVASFTFGVLDVEPGEHYTLGRIRQPATSFELDRTLPPAVDGTTCYSDLRAGQEGSTCGAYQSPATLSWTADDRDDTGKVNLLAERVGASNVVAGFGWVPGIEVADGGSADVTVPAWLTPVDVTLHLTNLPSPKQAGIFTGIQQNGSVYLHRNGGDLALSPGASATFSEKNPPAGVGAPFTWAYASSTSGTQSLFGSATTFDFAAALPLPTLTASADRTSQTLTVAWSPVPTGGVFATVVVSSGPTSSTWTVVAPATGTLVLPAFVPPGAQVSVSLAFIDVSTWSDADFRQKSRQLGTWAFGTSTAAPLPAFGPDALVKISTILSRQFTLP